MHWFCNFLRGKGIELRIHSGLQVLLMINENIFNGVKKGQKGVFEKHFINNE